MTNVIDMQAHRPDPHITLKGLNTVHVLPVSLIENVIEGRLSVAAVDAELVRDILADWLTQVQDEAE